MMNIQNWSKNFKDEKEIINNADIIVQLGLPLMIKVL